METPIPGVPTVRVLTVNSANTSKNCPDESRNEGGTSEGQFHNIWDLISTAAVKGKKCKVNEPQDCRVTKCRCVCVVFEF